MQTCYAEIIRSVLPDTGIAESQPLVIRSSAEQTVNWLIEEQIFNWARQKGFNPIFKSNPSVLNGNFYTIEFRPVSCCVSYEKLSSSHDSSVERTIQCALYLLFSGPEKEILASRTRSQTVMDTVLVKNLKNVENTQYSFTIGEKPRSFFSVIFEPVMISAVTGTIIYFFYSFRSK